MEILDRRRFGPLETAENLEDIAENLEAFIADACYVMEDEQGKSFIVEARQLFDAIGGLKVELYAKEHAPPHFHVKGNNIDASFVIESCELLNESISTKDRKKVEYWHKYSKPKLIAFWNKTRPSDCQVGPIAT